MMPSLKATAHTLRSDQFQKWKRIYHSQPGYEIGTDLETYVEFETEFAGKFKSDQDIFGPKLYIKEIKERKWWRDLP